MVDHGGFSAAARATGVPQATPRRRVAALEERIGARLLRRSTRRASLTPVGRRYHGHGRRIAEGLAAAQATASGLRAEPGGPLRITAPVVLGRSFLGAILAEFVRPHPAVAVTVEPTGRRVDPIEEGYDVAFRVGTLPSSTLVARRLGVGEAGLYASPDHLAADGEPAEPQGLARRRTPHNRSGEGAALWRLERSDGRVEEVAVTPAVRPNDVALLAGLAGLPSLDRGHRYRPHGPTAGVPDASRRHRCARGRTTRRCPVCHGRSRRVRPAGSCVRLLAIA